MPELRIHAFTIAVAGQSRAAILLCAGPMVPGSSEHLRAALAAAAATEAPVVEVDLRKVSQIDRGAAFTLLQARHDLACQGRELRLAVGAPAAALLRRWGAGALLDARSPTGADRSELPGARASTASPGRETRPEREER